LHALGLLAIAQGRVVEGEAGAGHGWGCLLHWPESIGQRTPEVGAEAPAWGAGGRCPCWRTGGLGDMGARRVI
jgi:hypothetical protein